MTHWTADHMPPQHGRTALVTGPGGVGFHTALQLARAGARVIVAGRHPQRGAQALQQIRTQHPAASVEFLQLDLASLRSVAAAALELHSRCTQLDLLINNAAIMAPPRRQTTADGYELQLGTNFLGHFALTGKLLPLLRKAPQARVVSLSSIAARSGRIQFDDLQAVRSYASMPVYAQSKLACLMFALELQRRSHAGQWGLSSLAAHPGLSRTQLVPNGAGQWSARNLARQMLIFMFQSAAQGALPALYAATAATARGGEYYGPHRLSETRGYPVPARIPAQALDESAAARLWREAEMLTQTPFPARPACAALES